MANDRAVKASRPPELRRWASQRAAESRGVRKMAGFDDMSQVQRPLQ